MSKRHRKPHRFKKRKPIYKNRFFWLGILVLALISSFFYFLFFSGFFLIEKINLSGQREIPEEKIILLAEKELENKILFFLKNNILLVKPQSIEESLAKNFPRIAKVQVSRSLPNELNILISEREMAAILCFLPESTECFALDKQGVIFEKKTPQDTPSWPLINVFPPEPEKETALGKETIKQKELISILKINSELERSLKIPIKEIVIASEEKLIVWTKENWQIFFNLQEDTAWQLEKLNALLQEKISESERKKLEYIELRFGNFANPKYIQSVSQDDI